MAEDQSDVDVARPQHPQGLGRLGLGQPDVHPGVLRPQHRRRRRDDRAERRGKRREPDTPRAQSRVRGQLVFRGVQAAQYFGRPVREQAPGLGEPDAPPRPLDQPDAGLGLQTGQVVAHRRLRVVELPGGGGH